MAGGKDCCKKPKDPKMSRELSKAATKEALKDAQKWARKGTHPPKSKTKSSKPDKKLCCTKAAKNVNAKSKMAQAKRDARAAARAAARHGGKR